MLNNIEQEPKENHRKRLVFFSVIITFCVVIILSALIITYKNISLNKQSSSDVFVLDNNSQSSDVDFETDSLNDDVVEVENEIIDEPEDSSTNVDIAGIVGPYLDGENRVSVAFRQLTGNQIHGQYNGGEVFVSASTYKLFTAYSVLKRIELGVFTWQDQNIHEGQDLRACFDKMMIYSDNNCAEAFMEKIGYSEVTKEVRALGLRKTTFISSDGYAKTSANDLLLFLSKIYNGEILSDKSNVDLLISNMKQNIFRSGIPAGVNGEVANKSGFIDGFLNDSAIIYDEKGVYALVILTEKSSWQDVAGIASKIEALRAQYIVD